MSPRPSRGSGWAVLLTVAVAILGGAFAVRARKRKRIAQPAPRPSFAPPPARTGRSDPQQALIRMAAGAAVVVVLAIVAVVVTRPSDNGLATPRTVMSPSAGPGGMYIQVAVPGPVDRDDRVRLTGDDGSQVEVGIRHHLDQPSYDQPGQENVFYLVHLHNTGRVPVGARLATDDWVVDAAGTSYRADPMRSEMVDQTERPPLEPGWEVDVEVGFLVPQGARLTRLHIALPLGSRTPTAEWNLR